MKYLNLKDKIDKYSGPAVFLQEILVKYEEKLQNFLLKKNQFFALCENNFCLGGNKT